MKLSNCILLVLAFGCTNEVIHPQKPEPAPVVNSAYEQRMSEVIGEYHVVALKLDSTRTSLSFTVWVEKTSKPGLIMMGLEIFNNYSSYLDFYLSEASYLSASQCDGYCVVQASKSEECPYWFCDPPEGLKSVSVVGTAMGDSLNFVYQFRDSRGTSFGLDYKVKGKKI